MFFVLITLGDLVFAEDVAYIYRKQFRIDENIVGVFEDLNLSVDLIQENSLPGSFDDYKFIFIGDESLRKYSRIPVNSFPTIVANYYHADEWGLTDAEGVSQLAANAPLNVRKDSRVVQVYTDWRDYDGIALPYYFLDKENRAPDLESVAFTEITASGPDYGAVISYADSGTRLEGGKMQQEKLCFFGIIESDYWTRAAKDMFKDCVKFVAADCVTDEDCPSGHSSAPFCGDDGNVYKTGTSYFCQNGEYVAQCVPSEGDVLVEECLHGCEFGVCKSGPHDVALVDFSNAVDKIKIVDSIGRSILGSELSCWEKYSIVVAVENKGYHVENVTFSGSIGSIPLTPYKISDLQPSELATRTRNNISLEEGSYTIEIEAVIPVDDSLSDNVARREVTVVCPVVSCSSDAECGEDSFVGEPYCAPSGNSIQDFSDFTCRNRGTIESYCFNETNPRLLDICEDECVDGSCVDVECYEDSDCFDRNPLTFDECINKGLVISECRNTPINCASDRDCGFTGFVGEEFCLEGDVSKNYQTSACLNEGTLESVCDIQVGPRTVSQCEFACAQGVCINCDSDDDCDDGEEDTLDICVSPGTVESHCSNPLINSGECISDSDCGPTTGLSDLFCVLDDVSKLVRTWSCENEGTPLSYCASDIGVEFVESCDNYCMGGECVSIACLNHVDCDDGEEDTLDICTNAGTEDAFCANNPIGVTCSSDLNCGEDGYIPERVCYGKDVTRIYQEFSCHSPGEEISFCSSRVIQEVVETCEFFCSAGECVDDPLTDPVCGNGVLEEGEECDDGNLVSGDECSSTCGIETLSGCTPRDTKQCGFSKVGLCRYGTKTCNHLRTWGSCEDAVYPETEVCDGEDNDCDGSTDEEGVCDPIVYPQCDDGLDNDNDGLIDYPADPGCSRKSDDSESPFNYPQCDDGLDNDHDGKIDYPADPQCSDKKDNNEAL